MCSVIETLHRQSREAWEKWAAELEASNKKYLVTINEMFKEKDQLKLALDTVLAELKGERGTALVAAVQLRRDNLLLRAKNARLTREVEQAYNDAKEGLNQVIETSKDWALKAFEILAALQEVPLFERRLTFQESVHWAIVIAEEPPTFLESSDDEVEDGEEFPNNDQEAPDE